MFDEVVVIIHRVVDNGLASKTKHSKVTEYIKSKKSELNNNVISVFIDLLKAAEINNNKMSKQMDKIAASHKGGETDEDAQRQIRLERDSAQRFSFKASLNQRAVIALKQVYDEINLPTEADLANASTIENKSSEVVAWEKKHQMEIVEKDGKIRVLHNGEKVSVVVSLSRLKGISSISISGENLVLKYGDTEKSDNIIMYYPQNNKLMQKTETSGTRALFTLSPQVSVVSNN